MPQLPTGSEVVSRHWMHRRTFLCATGGILVASALELAAEHHVISAEPLIVESELGSLTGRYTPVEDFYIRNHFSVPNAAASSLVVEGAVEKPGKFTLDSFAAIAPQELGAVLECAGGPLRPSTLTSAGVWRGWSLAEILALTSPRPAARYVHLIGNDGFSRSVPMGRAKDGLLATSLNGRPLGRNHGHPWRALFPGWYGMDSVKWLGKMVVADTALPPLGTTYLQSTRLPGGAVDLEPLPKIQVKSIITAPADGTVLTRGAVDVRGLAWSGSAKIASVQVSPDGGSTWQPAAVTGGGNAYDWALWQISFTLDRPGVVNLVAKATDDAGNTQPEKWDPRRADLYAYNVCHRIRCVLL